MCELTPELNDVCVFAGLSINVVDSDTDGLIFNVSSSHIRRYKLKCLERAFVSHLTSLMMDLRLLWPDNAALDDKLDLHFKTLRQSLKLQSTP